MKLSAAVKAYRATQDLTVRDAAEQIGVPYASLQRFESGGSYSAQLLIRVLLWLLTPQK